MAVHSAVEHEIVSLHEFFAAWYCGTCDRGEFARVERALADSFDRVAPDGSVATREVVLEGIRGAYDTHDTFDIEIRTVELVETMGNRFLVRYDEWQTTATGTNGRRSTALMALHDGGESVEWQALHETWLDPPQ